MVSSEEIERLTNQCVKCGLCLPWCPIYQKVLLEEASPRGRVQLAKRFLHPKGGEKIRPSERLAQAFFICTSCNACSSFCPSQIKPAEVIQEGREKIFEARCAPDAVEAVKRNILNSANAYGGNKEDRTAIYPASLREKVGVREKAKKTGTLIFFGCVASYLDMRIIPSLTKIMNAAGVEYMVLASEELCCGLPLYLMGDKKTYAQNAAEVMALMQKTGAKEVVTPCAGCYKSFRKYYPEVVKMDLEIFHSVQYIQRLIERKLLRIDGKKGKKITYHDPCDLGRSFQIFEEPRAIMKSLVGADFVEMEKNRIMARCCGGGGSMLALGPELAAEMAALRVRDAADKGAEIIVSGCSTCKDNLRKGIKAIPKNERPKMKVMDITEIVADSIQ
jgi:Fe-S oxidoreductase